MQREWAVVLKLRIEKAAVDGRKSPV